MKVRMRYVFRGEVQAVGFRYTARYNALALGLTGFVRNEYDGSVTMEVQGDWLAVKKIPEMMQEGRWIRIDDIEKTSLPLREDESSFRVTG